MAVNELAASWEVLEDSERFSRQGPLCESEETRSRSLSSIAEDICGKLGSVVEGRDCDDVMTSWRTSFGCPVCTSTDPEPQTSEWEVSELWKKRLSRKLLSKSYNLH